MNLLYQLIGRLVVAFVRSRYRRQLRVAAIAGGTFVLVAAVVAYLLGANREVEEG